MSWSRLIRRIHRWLAVAFLAGFLVNLGVIAAGEREPAVWIYLLALVPLFGLMPTGLYLFILPYAEKSRRTRK